MHCFYCTQYSLWLWGLLSACRGIVGGASPLHRTREPGRVVSCPRGSLARRCDRKQSLLALKYDLCCWHSIDFFWEISGRPTCVFSCLKFTTRSFSRIFLWEGKILLKMPVINTGYMQHKFCASLRLSVAKRLNDQTGTTLDQLNSTQLKWRKDKNNHWHRHKINTN